MDGDGDDGADAGDMMLWRSERIVREGGKAAMEKSNLIAIWRSV